MRLHFGFGRIHLGGTPFSGANVKPFISLHKDLKDQLMIIFNNSTQFTKQWLKQSFPSMGRNEECTGYLNELMGYPKASSLCEYCNIVLSRNTILRKHIDYKKDHQEGYNICSVYSYYSTINDDEYKVSIIMTTRTTVRSAYDTLGELVPDIPFLPTTTRATTDSIRSSGDRKQLTGRQKKVSNHITNMSECQRDVFLLSWNK